ncbi:MAG: hypothetical protein P8N76_13595 [Pirellulaceae bacterium]|nr:hypothetical protein [Pirellulaceae bacterium]
MTYDSSDVKRDQPHRNEMEREGDPQSFTIPTEARKDNDLAGEWIGKAEAEELVVSVSGDGCAGDVCDLVCWTQLVCCSLAWPREP